MEDGRIVMDRKVEKQCVDIQLEECGIAMSENLHDV